MCSPASDEPLPEALLRAEDLPTLPAVAVEVLRLCRDEETTLDQLAETLSQDAALSARLLRFANSSLYSYGSEIGTLQRAALVLGTKTVQLMALSFSLASSLPRSGRCPGFDYAKYWRRSLACAVAARKIAGLRATLIEDEAFLCGLLSEIGQLVLAQCLAREYAEVLRAAAGRWPTPELEHEILGFDHADVGQVLLRHWGLPQSIHAGIAHARRPADPSHDLPEDALQMVKVLRLATLTVDLFASENKADALARLEDEARTTLGLAAEGVYAFVTSLQSGIREASEMLNLQLGAQPTPAEILAEARAQRAALAGAPAASEHEPAGAASADPLVVQRMALNEDADLWDALTGIPDRTAFERFLAAEIAARLDGRLGRPLGLLLVGVDRLAEQNALWGREIGDEILCMVASSLRRHVRRGDLPARLESDLFAVVVAESDLLGLKALAERLRSAIAARELDVKGCRVRASVSIGGACLGSCASPLEGQTLVAVAGRYLRMAKKAGANRCVLHEGMLAPRSRGA
jgi:diguanylate cyclase (GGDEF)-like protein